MIIQSKPCFSLLLCFPLRVSDRYAGPVSCMTNDQAVSGRGLFPGPGAQWRAGMGGCPWTAAIRLGPANSEIRDSIRVYFTCIRTDTYRVQVKYTLFQAFGCVTGVIPKFRRASAVWCASSLCLAPCRACVGRMHLVTACNDLHSAINAGAHPSSPGTTCSCGAPRSVVGPAPQSCMACDPCACPGETPTSASDPFESVYVPRRPTWH